MDKNQSIAIVGLGGVFPGAADLSGFWENIRLARDCSREPPAGRWSLHLEDVYSANGPQPDQVYSKRACFVDDAQLDFEGLHIDREFLDSLDPMFHLLLHAGNQAWRSANTSKLDRQRVGIIIGNIALPSDAASSIADETIFPIFENQLSLETVDGPRTNQLNRYVAGLPAGILARALGLGGGTYTLDAACASSLYSLKYAVDELQAGRSDAMLCGGLSRPDSLYTQMGFSSLHAISASGRCSPFDVKGDGLVVGEGAGILVLKRLQDALDDGDEIHATIAGIGLSNDIEGNLMLPHSEGQLRAMHAAYKQADWQAEDIDLIECHGTGTPVGDVVEFNSLQSLWGSKRNKNDCIIGSVKSNIGHLLTAAGSAGLIKVLMAMKHETLPPTANFESASNGIDIADSPFSVLNQPRSWARRDASTPRRAAISAFGFGGINAHVLLQEWQGEKSAIPAKITTATSPLRKPDIAIVGMDSSFGPWQNLDSFRQRVLGGMEEFSPAAYINNWGAASTVKGYCLDKIEIPLRRFRIPPNELKEMLPQQLLMLLVASNAIADAKLSADVSAVFSDAGVYIGIGLDPSTTNFHLRWGLKVKARQWARQLGLQLDETELESWVRELRDAFGPAMNANRTMGALGGIVASRIARAFNVGGPSFTLSSEESSGLRSLEAGVRALQRNEISTAIVGAVDIASDIRSLGKAQGAGSNLNDTLKSDGAAAVILKRHEDALADGDQIYAIIKGMGAANAGSATAKAGMVSAYKEAVKRSINDAGVELDSISLVEGHADSQAEDKAMEIDALGQLFRERSMTTPCALTNVKADIGHSGAAGGLASLVKTTLCLHHQVIPAHRGAEDLRADIKNSEALYAPRQSQFWLRDSVAGPRRALISSFSVDGNFVNAVVEGVENNTALSNGLNDTSKECLFSICAENKKALIDSLQRLMTLASASSHSTLPALAARWWHEQAENQRRAQAVSIIGSGIDELLTLLNLALKKVEADESHSDDKLFYSVEPLASKGKVAYVFPGSGSHFIGMGREMSTCWSQVLARLDDENESLSSQFASSRFWARENTSGFTNEDFIFGQVWLGAMVSDVISSFAVNPEAVIGYCLGESVGLFATRTWNDRDLMLKRIQETRLFSHDLGGSCDAARLTWGAGSDEEINWQLGVVDCPADKVKAKIAGRKRVYLMIINTPSECIIGGDGDALLSLVKDLDCGFHPLEGVTTVHCDVVKAVEEAYRDLHLFDTHPPQGLAFYSGVAASQYDVTRESAADSIVRQALETFDYTKLINAAYEDGFRIFIEMGPGASCSRMIGQILGERQHIARSACVNGQSDHGNVLRILAQLNTERLPVDLSSLYSSGRVHRQTEDKSTLSVDVGKAPIVVHLPEQSQNESTRVANKESRADILEYTQVQTQNNPMSAIMENMMSMDAAHAETQATFLRVANGLNQTLAQAISTQMHVLQSVPSSLPALNTNGAVPTAVEPENISFDRDMCMEFATGSIAKVLGPAFAEVDSFPSRVRLPDEPLMLVDRILEVEGEVASMSSGRVLTEHDVKSGAWYLDAGRIPTCIAVEAGQADLFLSAYLGIDLLSKGLAVYRLLDAEVCFHAVLPQAGQVIQYDIHIDEFFRQGTTWLFRFHFHGTVDGQPLITMRKGCAGFFTQAELDAGRGIVQTTLESRAIAGKCAEDWQHPMQMRNESFSDEHINALHSGDLAACFGEDFTALPLARPAGLPGGKMTLVHRILALEPDGGRFGLGKITGEADIDANDWFLTCHFIDDQVMPGTLMYECCLHTLRVYLLRMGWVGERDEFVYEPILGVTSKLKCRGQVLASTEKVQYEISIKEIGYTEKDKTPYVIADALMFADGRAIVQMGDMSLQLSGLSKTRIDEIWSKASSGSGLAPIKSGQSLFDYSSINAFAVGKPSQAFGDKYEVFDAQRVIARLPGPPFQFLDRIVSIKDCEAWQLKAGGVIEGEYDIPEDAWYFAADRQNIMPFSVLLEIALQPCGWLAAYLGSALNSDADMSFRNLGGKATQFLMPGPDSGTLNIKIKITNVALSGGMIIQNYDFEVRSREGVVYVGDTYFGFFSKAALADQVGIREVESYAPSEIELARSQRFAYPEQAPYPQAQMRMVDEIDCFDAEGGPQGLGFIRGLAKVDTEAWFFKAHFHQDPVWPGSLGLESFMQLLKVVAEQRWGRDGVFQCMALGQAHSWLYRGQILPSDELVSVQACITAINDEECSLKADGFLSVDGRIIYQMNDFALRMAK